MKLSTARKAWLLSFVSPEKAVALMFTAQRICINGQTKRYGYADGSVLESVNGVWKVVKKNPKLEAAVKRFGNPGKDIGRVLVESSDTVSGPAKPFINPNKLMSESKFGIVMPPTPTREELCNHFKVPLRNVEQMQAEIDALQALLNDRDERLDHPMVVRLDWWLIGLVGLVFLANEMGYL